ncbi:hypothetical protein [Streptomyces mirabilis]|uniref:hypothetical protein n=1 Tax=Streptomyces mirabilis TaxID=68239 RepID=UPI0036BBE76B
MRQESHATKAAASLARTIDYDKLAAEDAAAADKAAGNAEGYAKPTPPPTRPNSTPPPPAPPPPRPKDDREDLLRQVAVVAGAAGQGHEDPLGCLDYPVHLFLPHGVDRHGRAARWRARYGRWRFRRGGRRAGLADGAVGDVGEPARDRLDGSEPAPAELVAAACGYLRVLGYFGMGAFYGTGLDHRQEVLYLPRPCAGCFKETGHATPGARSCLCVHDDQR